MSEIHVACPVLRPVLRLLKTTQSATSWVWWSFAVCYVREIGVAADIPIWWKSSEPYFGLNIYMQEGWVSTLQDTSENVAGSVRRETSGGSVGLMKAHQRLASEMNAICETSYCPTELLVPVRSFLVDLMIKLHLQEYTGTGCIVCIYYTDKSNHYNLVCLLLLPPKQLWFLMYLTPRYWHQTF